MKKTYIQPSMRVIKLQDDIMLTQTSATLNGVNTIIMFDDGDDGDADDATGKYNNGW